MSSKGQVVIPEDVRNRLGLTSGAQFLVMGENDVVILKTISPPSMADFDGIVQRARRQARAAGMKPSDIGRGGLGTDNLCDDASGFEKRFAR